jgi:hypothetical protein
MGRSAAEWTVGGLVPAVRSSNPLMVEPGEKARKREGERGRRQEVS